jgi:hypothetical protein
MRSEVYSWRLRPALKQALEEEARQRGSSVADLLEGISEQWLLEVRKHRSEQEAAEQERLHAAALPFVGSIEGIDPERSSRVRELVRAGLRRRLR